jgi:hypothetical protein
LIHQKKISFNAKEETLVPNRFFYSILAGLPGTAGAFFTISLIDLKDKREKIRRAAGWVLSGAGLPGQVKSRAPAKIQENSSKANTPFGVVGTCGPRVEVSPPKIKFYHPKPPQGATFVCCTFVNSQSMYSLLVGWTLWALGWGELPRNKILQTNPPRGATFVFLPLPNA